MSNQEQDLKTFSPYLETCMSKFKFADRRGNRHAKTSTREASNTMEIISFYIILWSENKCMLFAHIYYYYKCIFGTQLLHVGPITRQIYVCVCIVKFYFPGYLTHYLYGIRGSACGLMMHIVSNYARIYLL